MGSQCDVCGKKPVVGNQYTKHGKAKYLGGVGRKSDRHQQPTVRAQPQSLHPGRNNGAVKRMRVCVKCIRSGRVQRPQRRKPFQMATNA